MGPKRPLEQSMRREKTRVTPGSTIQSVVSRTRRDQGVGTPDLRLFRTDTGKLSLLYPHTRIYDGDGSSIIHDAKENARELADPGSWTSGLMGGHRATTDLRSIDPNRIGGRLTQKTKRGELETKN